MSLDKSLKIRSFGRRRRPRSQSNASVQRANAAHQQQIDRQLRDRQQQASAAARYGT